jgi:hypothetical protein
MVVSMANLYETSNPECIAALDSLGWLLATLIVVVTAAAWIVACNLSFAI